MKRSSAKKLEIFLLLALRQSSVDASQPPDDTPGETDEENAPPENEDGDGLNEIFSAFSEQLTATENEKLERLYANYLDKSEDDRQEWRREIAASIGADETPLIDDGIHFSHVAAALKRERPAIQKIAASALPSAYKNLLETDRNAAKIRTSAVAARSRLEKTVRDAFARQFVALRDLPGANVFDGLSGAQLARLARLAGIREVAYACAGISAVEAVGAFLRRFAPEDGRAVAAQLSGLPKISAERLAFAETLVQNALEVEAQQPSSAMLDWIGIRLIGVLLCAPASNAATARVAYTEQKLPLETAPKLSEIIEAECRKTPIDLRRKIGAQIERLAETVAKSGA